MYNLKTNALADENESATNDNEWEYLNQLLFLEDHICHRPVISSLTDDNLLYNNINAPSTSAASTSIWLQQPKKGS